MTTIFSIAQDSNKGGSATAVHVRRCASIENLHAAHQIVNLQDKLNAGDGSDHSNQDDGHHLECLGDHIGRWEFDNGHYYGEWKAGKAHGLGERVAEDWTYVGSWLSGKQNGLGTMHIDRLSLKGHAVERQAEAVYCGQWLNGNKHGFGLERDDCGQFIGVWQKGKRGRYGVFKADEGWTYTGTFINEQFGGLGQETLADGTQYDGEFRNGVRHGCGMMAGSKSAEGLLESSYAGEWVLDKRNGFGVEMTSSGQEVYAGEFENNDRHGYGMATVQLGAKMVKHQEGKWKNDKFVSKKQPGNTKVVAAVGNAKKAAQLANEAMHTADEYIRVARERAQSAEDCAKRTRGVIDQTHTLCKLFDKYKHDSVSEETLRNFPKCVSAPGVAVNRQQKDQHRLVDNRWGQKRVNDTSNTNSISVRNVFRSRKVKQVIPPVPEPPTHEEHEQQETDEQEQDDDDHDDDDYADDEDENNDDDDDEDEDSTARSHVKHTPETALPYTKKKKPRQKLSWLGVMLVLIVTVYAGVTLFSINPYWRTWYD